MFSSEQLAELWRQLAVSHVVWLPDSALGPWESSFDSPGAPKLLRVCREGEAWALAAGLYLGGANPLVVIQNTGFFESGDALRNVLFDLGLPLAAWIGYRGYLVPNSADTARRFTEPVLQAWGLEYALIERAEDWPRIVAHHAVCRAAARPAIVLLAEGKG